MRPGPNSRRARGRNSGGGQRRPGGNLPNRNQTIDSNGPDVRIRGTVFQVYEKYMALARDAQASGDRVMAENYQQHAEHYIRIINQINEAYAQAQQPQQHESQGWRGEPGYGEQPEWEQPRQREGRDGDEAQGLNGTRHAEGRESQREGGHRDGGAREGGPRDRGPRDGGGQDDRRDHRGGRAEAGERDMARGDRRPPREERGEGGRRWRDRQENARPENGRAPQPELRVADPDASFGSDPRDEDPRDTDLGLPASLMAPPPRRPVLEVEGPAAPQPAPEMRQPERRAEAAVAVDPALSAEDQGTVEQTAETAPAEPAPVKRPRGRPRKVKPAETVEEQPASEG